RRVMVSNNTIQDCKLGMPVFNGRDITIFNNRFLRGKGRNYKLEPLIHGVVVTVRAENTRVINNVFENRYCISLDGTTFQGNEFRASKLQMAGGGTALNNTYYNGQLQLINDSSRESFRIYAKGERFYNTSGKAESTLANTILAQLVAAGDGFAFVYA